MNSQQLAERAREAAARQASPDYFRAWRVFGLAETKGLGGQAGLWALVAVLVVFLANPAPLDYQVGQVADQTIRADHGFQFLDLAATMQKKLEAESEVPPVFIMDDLLAGLLEKQARQLFQRAREILAGNQFPKEAGRLMALDALKPDFLTLHGLSDDSPVWPDLLAARFDETLEKQALSLAIELMANGFVADEDVSALPGASSAIMIINVSNRAEYIMPRPRVLTGRPAINRALDIQGRKLAVEYDQKAVNLILALARGLTRPNLKPDQAQTREMAWRASAEVQDIYVYIRPGQIIVQEGTVIEQEDMDKIMALKDGQTRGLNWLGRFAGLFLALFLFYNLILALFSLNQHRLLLPPPREQAFMALIVLLALLAANTALVFGAALSWDFDFVDSHTIFLGQPLPAAAMLASVFFGQRQATLVLILVAVTVTAVIPGEGRFMVMLYIVNGGIIALLCLRNMKERKALVPASFWVMVVNCLTLMSMSFMSDSAWGRQTVNNFLAAAACGFFSGVLTSGLIPLVEMAFGFNTNLKMLELGNLDSPVLRECMLSAPGTYHHSVIVGAMVEAAAEGIGANPYVAKVGAYYHDIGKMKKPLYFVENQSGENRHDTLAPSMSALVLLGHVREGADLARASRLPRVIIDIIEQHHGASLMSFFYHKAKDQHQPGQPEVNEGDFRYPGPKPRSAEAGLVMLGDICEAATRSMAEHTPLKIRNMVKSAVNQVFSDGQLDECDLKASELAVIINIFTTILIGIYHQRVAYPRKTVQMDEAPWPEGGKTKEPANAHLSVQPSKNAAH